MAGKEPDGRLQAVIEGLEKRGAVSMRGRYHRGRGKLEKDYMVTRKVLGVGINGSVRLAKSRGNVGRQYAVKTFRFQNTSGPRCSMKDLASEIDIALAVDHPHTVRALDLYETEAELHLVMECMRGGELFDRLVKRKRFNEKDAAESARQMLSAVSYLHGQGIVHRDLKPENFLYETMDSSHLRLIDFGFSKRWNGSTPMTERCGTMSFSAPEVFKKNYTNQCDVWSLGVTIFMLLSGYAPFEGDKDKQMADIVSGNYKWRQDYWKDVSSDGIDFVKSLLSSDPNERPTAQAALQHRWLVGMTQMPPTRDMHLGVLESIRDFRRSSELRRACLATTIACMTSGDIEVDLRNFFLSVSGPSGVIEARRLVQDLQSRDSFVDEELQQALGGLSLEDSVSYSDFLAAMIPSFVQPQEELLLEAFRHFDADPVPYMDSMDSRQASFKGAIIGEQKRKFRWFRRRERRLSLEGFSEVIRQDVIARPSAQKDLKMEPSQRCGLSTWLTKIKDNFHRLPNGTAGFVRAVALSAENPLSPLSTYALLDGMPEILPATSA